MEIYQNISLEDLPKEEWRYVPDYNNRYMVSNLGRVKSLSRYIPFKDGNLRLTKTRILRQSINPQRGYPLIILQKNNLCSTREVHRLVGQLFIENPENKPSVNHIDGIKYNNCVDNLEWNTWKEQIIHSYNVLGHKAKGKRVAKLNDNKDILEEFESVSDVKRKYNFNIGNIAALCRGVHNKRVGGFYWKYI